MPANNIPASAAFDVTIIGGGAASAMLLMQWQRQQKWPGRVAWCESTGQFGLGAAYRTTHPRHVLNVVASKMGCFPDAVDDFLQWVKQSDALDAIAAREDTTVPVAEAYLPRRLYGQYLQARLNEHLAPLPADALTRIPEAVFSIEPSEDGGYIVSTTSQQWHSKHLVLAMGNQPNFRWGEDVKNSPYWLGNTWQPQLGALPKKTDKPLLVIGAGLSAVDTVLSLRDAGWRGDILLASRHGHWPLPHVRDPIAPYPHAFEDVQGKRPSALLHHIRALVRAGHDWRSVVDGLRPHTIMLWQRLSEQDQARFLKRLWPWWNIHRHRMAAQATAWLDAALPGAQREPLANGVKRIEATPDGLLAHMQDGSILHPAAIADCTGPSLSILANPGPLHGLLDAGLILPARNGAGLQTDRTHAAYAGSHGTILALGTLTLGMRFETTAIPELRKQAAEVAAHPLPLW